jgi:HAD superfamily hydrolase (TIGR01509 family)
VETQLRRLELEAVLSAPLTPNAAEAVRGLHLAGFTVTVVSNNSTDAIRSFLVLHKLAAHVRGISGRTRVDPSFLKPNPFLIEQAVASLGTKPQNCVMIDDSLADIKAAQTARVSVIGIGNRLRQQAEHGQAVQEPRRRPRDRHTRSATPAGLASTGLIDSKITYPSTDQVR